MKRNSTDGMEMGERKLHCLALGSDGAWEAICLDLDLAVQGRSFEEASAALRQAIDLYLEHVATLPTAERTRFMARRVPLLMRLRFAVKAFALAMTQDSGERFQHHYTMPCSA